MEVRKNEPYKDHPLLGNEFSEGQYTYKVYKLASRVPNFVRMIVPKGSRGEVHEEAHNGYPYCRTVLSNPGYMKENFEIKIESYHLADHGNSENVHQLPPEKLKCREVVHIDIAKDKVAAADYKEDQDPTKFKSEKTGRGPLINSNWKNEVGFDLNTNIIF